MPVDDPMPAMEIAELLHVPPADASERGTEDPAHTCVGPDIPNGSGFTVTIAVV